jgi:NAD(P)-dependent dehydrogenase (short-subunit alcohol dehydrogenase family)
MPVATRGLSGDEGTDSWEDAGNSSAVVDRTDGRGADFWAVQPNNISRTRFDMGNTLQDRIVVVVGRASGIARAVTLLARSEGARVVVAGRDKDKLAAAYDDAGITAEAVDVTDDESIGALAERVGPVDHLVSTASARARGKLAELERRDLQLSFDTKVIGRTMLAKHFASQIQPGGSLVLFSGVNAFKVNVGYLGVAITNGVIDTGAWDSMGDEGKRAYFEHVRDGNPVRRIGTTEDVADAVLFAMTNAFLTGVTLKIDGGEPLT